MISHFLLLLVLTASSAMVVAGQPRDASDPTSLLPGDTPQAPAAPAAAKVPPPQEEPFGWVAQVIKVSQPEELLARYSGDEKGKPEGPSQPAEGQKWLSVTVSLTRPEASKRHMPVKLIAVNDGSSSYPLAAVAYRELPTYPPFWKFVREVAGRQGKVARNQATKETIKRLERLDPEAVGSWTTVYAAEGNPVNRYYVPIGQMYHLAGAKVHADLSAVALLWLMKDKRSGENMFFAARTPIQLEFLFAVPVNAENLSLQLAEAAPVPLPPAEKSEALPQ